MSKPKRRPTEKQTRFVQAISNHKTAKDAALEAGYSPKVANHPGKIIRNIAKTTLLDKMEAKGLNDDFLADHAKDAMSAMRTVHIGGGETVNEADWFARHKYFNSILHMKGLAGTVKHTHEGMIGVDVRAMLVGAFSLMAKSQGMSIDIDQLTEEVGRMAGVVPEDQVEVPAHA